MRSWTIGCLMAGIACTSAGAETPQSDRRNRQLPELVVESQGRRGTCDVLTFTRDGQHLLAVGDDRVVRVWKYRDGQIDPRSLTMLRWSVWGPQRGAIYALAVSPDRQGQRVAIGGVGIKTTAAAVIDRASGDILATIYANDHPAAPRGGGFQSVRAITFSPKGDRVAFGSADGSVWLWNYERKGEEELKWLGTHSRAKAGFNRVRLLHFRNERILLSVAQNGEVFQWDLTAQAPQPERLKWLDDVGGPIHDVILSQDGKWLAARAMNKPRIYVRSLDGKQRKDIALEENTAAGSLAFENPGRLAAGIRSTLKNDEGFYLESNDQLCLFDLSQEDAKVSQGPPHSGHIDVLAFHPDGKHLAAAGGDDHEVTLWDLRRPKERPTVLRGVGSGIWNVALSEGGRYLAFQTQRDPKPTHPNRRGRGPWTLFDLRRRQWASVPGDFTPAAPLQTQEGWQVQPDRNDASIWYVARRGQQPLKLPWNKDLQAQPRCYAFLPRAKGQPVRLAVGHYYGVSVFAVTEKQVRPIWQGMGHEGEVVSLAVSPQDDWLVSASDDQTVSAWSLTDWPSGSELGASFADNGKGQVVVEKVDFFGPAWEAGMSAGDRIFGLQIGREVTFFRPKVDGAKPEVGSIDACLEALKHPQPGKPLIFRLQRGRDEWIDVLASVRRRPLWRFFPTRNKEWVLWMGANPYYETSNNGDQYLGWQLNNRDDLKKTPNFYPAEQFRNLFHKPAVIDKLLAERDIRQALNESGAGLTPPNFDRLFDTVSVRIAARAKQVADADVQVTLQIKSRTENPDYAPVRAELWVNDHRLMVWPPKKGDPFPRTWTETWTIERKYLRAGDNDVVLQCYNRVERRGEGRLEASTRVHCERTVRQRKLYGLVVGFNDYSRSALTAAGKPLLHDLHTPQSDMEAIRKAWLSQRGGKLYADVDITFVSEKTVNTDRQTVLKELKELAKKGGPDDQVFVFLAGHGMVLDPTGQRDFVFCCPDFDPRKPETYISADELYAALADISGRKVVFLDVCHSGEVIRPVRRLTPGGRGPTIFAACDSGESSWEPLGTQSAKHSFFVSALLEAFQRGDRDNNDLLDAHEIFEYASERVPELLGEANLNATQTPTCFPRPLGQNFLLARGRR